ncbi:MAG: hypothetical protein K8H84_01600 [Sulfuricella denitrificans]|nr:hypothetical protein [Sulfuricella denitrificans]
MKWTTEDWRFLRASLLTLLTVLLLGGALVFFTHQWLGKSRDIFRQQQDALQEARNRLYKSGEEKERILRYRGEFLALQQHGLIGEEQRINWVDALRAASLQLKMFGISYQIDAQQVYQSPAVTNSGAYRLRQSVMKISMGLLHEEDLSRFMTTLASLEAGFFMIRECDLQRQGSGRSETVGVQPHLNAECSLAWLTMSEGKAGEVRP